jgi:8-oxo-dGTP pyrophosphatase MutT (NUDIX family)
MEGMNSTDFRNWLAERMLTLPGPEAQDRMSSRSRLSIEEYLQRNPDYRTSAVMLLLFPSGDFISSLLIERPSYEGVHSGQLALPGGRSEETDEDLLHTAIRETFEEVGVNVKREQVLGALTPIYIPPSRFLVHPFIAFLDERPEFIPDEREVESLLEVNLSLFLDEEVKQRRRITVGDNMFLEAPCYVIGDKILWGATAMMFSEMESILRGE